MSAKKKKRVNILSTLVLEIIIFCLVLFLGLFSAIEAKKIIIQEEIEISLIGFEGFLAYFVLATLIILLIIYIPKIKKYQAKIYKFFFIFSSLFGALTVLSVFLPDLFSIPLIILLFILWLKKRNVLIHDILIILALSGIGYFFGLAIEPKTVILLLLVLSFYDFIAVYKTKHMVKMAGSMLKSGAIMGIIVPQKLKDFTVGINQVKPGGKFMVLGGGDIIFPLIFSVSMLETGFLPALIVALFSILGLIASLMIFMFQKEKKPIPALPPIALFSIIGYIITLIL